MLYLRNTNQIQTIDKVKVGGREDCYYGFVTNPFAVAPDSYTGPCNSQNQTVTWNYARCDNPTQQSIIVSSSLFNPGYTSLGCVSATRFTVPAGFPTPGGTPQNREAQMLFSPFTCETQFTQSMTNYQYVTFQALGTPLSAPTDPNNAYAFGLASYIPSGSNQYVYKVIQLIPNCNYPSLETPYAPFTPLWGPIAIVSGSAYYSINFSSPKGNADTAQFISYSAYP
jgi:hypothetical protein